MTAISPDQNLDGLLEAYQAAEAVRGDFLEQAPKPLSEQDRITLQGLEREALARLADFHDARGPLTAEEPSLLRPEDGIAAARLARINGTRKRSNLRPLDKLPE